MKSILKPSFHRPGCLRILANNNTNFLSTKAQAKALSTPGSSEFLKIETMIMFHPKSAFLTPKSQPADVNEQIAQGQNRLLSM